MIEDHSVFKQPPEDMPLWRYMDLAKFLSMLHTSSLYFARSDKMEDTFEAAFPKPYVDRQRARYAEIQAIAKNSLPDFSMIGTIPPNDFYLSCWYMNRHESAAMWKLYCGQGEGIAVCSTLRQLKAATQGSPFRIFAGTVNYIDYETEDFVDDGGGNALVPILHKRKSFEHEKEMRLVIWGTIEYLRLNSNEALRESRIGIPIDVKKFPVGYEVTVKLSDMVSRVMVSPTAEKWYKEVVRASLEKFGYPEIPIEQSPLYSKPVY